jgi:uncharacterized protein YggE
MKNSATLPLLFVLTLSAIAPSIATAQVEPRRSPETAPQIHAPTRSLTVIGQGQVTAPADAARLEFRLGNRDFGSDRRSTGSETDRRTTTNETERQQIEKTLQPIVKLLLAAGIPERDIVLETRSPQNPKLRVTVMRPTQDRLQEIVQLVERSFSSSGQLILQGTGAAYLVNNCQPFELAARRIALQDARRQLGTLAIDVGAELGELMSVTVFPIVAPASVSSCGSKVGVSTSTLSLAADETTPPYDPTDNPEVQIRSQVSVTHRIKSDRLPR